MTVSRGSPTARLARVGFTEPSSAALLLDAPALAGLAGDDRLLTALAATADPDAALTGLTLLLEKPPRTPTTSSTSSIATRGCVAACSTCWARARR